MRYLLSLIFLLLSVATANAQTGFILVGPGTQRATCTDITAPVTNQTWCANGSLGPTGYTWFVWNGTAWVPISGGGGGGGTPGGALGSTQFNDNTGFGGSQAPVYVSAFTTANGCAGGTGINGRSMQCAINSAPVGGLVQLDCTNYSVSDVTTVLVSKALTIQGCTSQGGGIFTPFTVSSVISGGVNQTVFTIDTFYGVTIRDLTIKNGAVGTGILITATGTPTPPFLTPLNVRSRIERTWINGGDYGIVGALGKTGETQVIGNFVSEFRKAGISFGGLYNPSSGVHITGSTHTNTTMDSITPNTTGLTAGMPVLGSGIPAETFIQSVDSSSKITLSAAATSSLTGVQFTISTSNCDGGAYKILNNAVESGTGSVADGYLFTNTAALTFIGNSNAGGALVHGLHMQIGPASHPCVGPGPTQVVITQNQLISSRSNAFLLEGFYSTGSYEIANNFFGSEKDDVVQLTSTVNSIFAITYTGNTHQTIHQVGAGSVNFKGVFASTVSGNALAMGEGTLFAALGTPANGTTLYCPDCIVGNPCTGPGPSPGAVATRTAGVWVCTTGSNYAFKATDSLYGLVVSDNTMTNPIGASAQYQGDGYYLRVMNDRGGLFLSTLPDVLPGSQIQCTDCVRGTNPCVAGPVVTGQSTSAFRVGIGAEVVWSCSLGPPTWSASALSSNQNGAENKAALQAMIAALPATGGHLTLPTGTLLLDPGIVIDRPLVLEGAVQASPNGSIIVSTSTTADLFLVTTLYAVAFRNLTIGAQTTPVTAGAYIHFNGTPTINGGSIIDNVTFVGCMTCLDFEAARAWQVTNSGFLTRQHANAVAILQRSTDPSFGGFWINRNSFGNGSALGTAIKITSGGNTNISDNIVLGMAKGLWFDWDNPTGGGDFKVTRNSFNGNTPITLQTEAGGGSVSVININGNTFSGPAVASVRSEVGAVYSIVTIENNILDVPNGTTGFDLGIAATVVVGNLIQGGGAASVGINIQATATDTHVEANKFIGTWANEIVDAGIVSTLSLNAFSVNLVIPTLASANNCLVTDAAGIVTAVPCAAGGTVGGTGSSPQISVWSGASTLTGFADFTWDDTNHNFVAGLTPSLGAGATNSAILGGTSGSIAAALTNAVSINGGVVTTDSTTAVGGEVLDQGTTSTLDGSATGSAIVGSLTSSITGSATNGFIGGSIDADIIGPSGPYSIIGSSLVSSSSCPISAIVGSDTSTCTGSQTTAIIGASNATIGSGATRAVIVGGNGGSVTGSISSAVSINGGVVTTSDTTTIGGSLVNIDFVGTNDLSGAGGASLLVGGGITETGGSNVLRGYTITNSGSAVDIGGFGITNSGGSAQILGFTITNIAGSVQLIGNQITNGSDDTQILGEQIINTADDCSSCVVVGQVIDFTGLSLSSLAVLSYGGLTGSGGYVVADSNGVRIGKTDLATAPEIIVTSGVTSVANGAHGQSANIKTLTEETTILVSAFTDTTIQAPANSLVLGVSVRVTTIIPTAATFDVGVAGATTRYGTGILVAATTTFASPGTTNPTIYGAATSIRITPNLMPLAATGKVRVTITYLDLTPPSS